MALESKPLFHPEVLRHQVRSFNLPDQTAAWQPKLQHWAELITSGRADTFKETALLSDFLSDIFCGLLGYAGPAATADAYTLSRERHVEVDGKVADAVLGHFRSGNGTGRDVPPKRPCSGGSGRLGEASLPRNDGGLDTEQFVAVLEGKGARDPLDHPVAGRRMSAVDQAYRYALYAEIRQRVLTRLCRENAAVAPQEILRCIQELLDRVLFCAFCEDRGLLPAKSLHYWH